MGLKDALKIELGGKGKKDGEPEPGKKSPGKRGKVRSLPNKRTLNLAASGEKPINPLVALPSIGAIIVISVLLSKFFVVDRLIEVSRAQSEVAAMQSQVNAAYDRLDDFGELTDVYAHYTYSGMTAEELSRTDRVAVLELLQRVVIPQAWVTSWSLSSNILTLDITRGNLQEINLLAQQLNEEPLVDFCTVTTAATTNKNVSGQTVEDQGEVTGQMLVYLKSKDDATADLAAAEEEGESQSSLAAAIDKTTETANSLDASRRAAEQMGEETP